MAELCGENGNTFLFAAYLILWTNSKKYVKPSCSTEVAVSRVLDLTIVQKQPAYQKEETQKGVSSAGPFMVRTTSPAEGWSYVTDLLISQIGVSPSFK